MSQEHFGFGLLALALIGGLFLAKTNLPDPAPMAGTQLGSVQINTLSIDDAWVAETIGAQDRTAAYFSIHNGSGEEDRLMAVTSNVGAHVGMHQTLTEDGVSSMRSVDAIILQSGTTLRFAPGGYHVMIMGLEAPLTAGEEIELTVDLLEAGRVSFVVPVRTRASMLNHGGSTMDHSGH